MPGWIDAHNHLQDPRLGSDPGAQILSMREAGIIRCVVNATREEDWHHVLNLYNSHPDFVIPTLGIHPWHAHSATHGWVERLQLLLESHPAAGIGECGLDRWVESPTLEIQLPVFLQQIRLARQLDRPLTIHCLKAWGALDEAFAIEPPPRRFLMHSYGGSLETARNLAKQGAWFSFSGYFLHPRKSAVLNVFRALPPDKILLETDAPDMLPPPAFIRHPMPDGINHPANLPAIGQGLADALGITIAELRDLTNSNAERFLGKQGRPPHHG